MGSMDRTVEYLRAYGLDAADVSSDFDEDGYWRLERDKAGKVIRLRRGAYKTWHPWPAGFDVEVLCFLIDARLDKGETGGNT